MEVSMMVMMMMMKIGGGDDKIYDAYMYDDLMVMMFIMIFMILI